MPPLTSSGRLAVALAGAVLLAVSAAACGDGPVVTPPITPGTSGDPREVVIVMKDYAFIPSPVDLVPGETVIFQVINGGLVTHEAVVGPMPVQDAWEAAEAATAGAPPGPTPQVSVAPGLAGPRIVVTSGERKDVPWTVPISAAADPGGWFVGCHIPGHWAAGMVVPVRFVGPDGEPLRTREPLSTPGVGTNGTLRAPGWAGGSAASR